MFKKRRVKLDGRPRSSGGARIRVVLEARVGVVVLELVDDVQEARTTATCQTVDC